MGAHHQHQLHGRPQSAQRGRQRQRLLLGHEACIEGAHRGSQAGGELASTALASLESAFDDPGTQGWPIWGGGFGCSTLKQSRWT